MSVTNSLRWTPVTYDPNSSLIKEAMLGRLAFGDTLTKLGTALNTYADGADKTLQLAKAQNELYDTEYKDLLGLHTSLFENQNLDAINKAREAIMQNGASAIEPQLAALAKLPSGSVLDPESSNTLPVSNIPEVLEQLRTNFSKIAEEGQKDRESNATVFLHQQQGELAKRQAATEAALLDPRVQKMLAEVGYNKALTAETDAKTKTENEKRPGVVREQNARAEGLENQNKEWNDAAAVRTSQNYLNVVTNTGKALTEEDKIRAQKQAHLTRDLLGNSEYIDALTKYYNGELKSDQFLAKIYQINPKAKDLIVNPEELNALIKSSERHDELTDRDYEAAKVANAAARAALQSSGRRRWDNPLLPWDSMFDPEDPLKGSIAPLFEGQTGAEVTSAKRFASQEVGRLVNDILKEHPEIGRDAEDKIMLANALLQTASNPQNKSKLAAALLKGTKLDQTFFNVGEAINLYDTYRGSKDLNAPFVRRIYGKDGLIDLDAQARELAIQDVRLRKSPNFQTAYAQRREALYTNFQENSGLNKDQLAYADRIWKALPNNSGGTMPEFTPFVPPEAPTGKTPKTKEQEQNEQATQVTSGTFNMNSASQTDLDILRKNPKVDKETRQQAETTLFDNIKKGDTQAISQGLDTYLTLDPKSKDYKNYRNSILFGAMRINAIGGFIQPRILALRQKQAELPKTNRIKAQQKKYDEYEATIQRLLELNKTFDDYQAGRLPYQKVWMQ